MLKRALLAAIAVFLLLHTAVFAAPELKPEDKAFLQASQQFIQTLAAGAVEKLTDSNLPLPQREATFHQMLKENFDIPKIGRFVVGRYWRTATPAQQQEFVKLFEDMLVQLYMSRLKEYKGETLKVTGAKLDAEGRYALVQSEVFEPSVNKAVAVEWRVVRSAPPFKIADVVVEGISMGLSQRSEYASVIQRGGGTFEALLVELRKQKVTAKK